MNKSCERSMEQNQDSKKPEACLERAFISLTVDDVYEIAKLIGSEVEKLIDVYGKESAEGLVPKIVKVLELLESFAARNHVHSSKEEELLKAFETLQVQQQKKRGVKESEDSSNNNEIRQELQQKEEKWRRRAEELQAQVLHLQEENQELLCQLRSQSQGDRVQRQEREVMLKLKEVVDKQRDEIRAKVQEIATVSKEVEALQEQLERFMKMNAELRHKQSVTQAQVKSAVERKADLETDLREKHKEIERLTAQLEKATAASAVPQQASPGHTELDLTDKLIIDLKDPNRPCFTKQEVRDMLFERNELKANLFLVQEELAYYQREILNDERCPGFLLDAVRSAIKKQRTVIKAKMLGIPVDQCSSDEDDKGPLFESRDETDGDCPDGNTEAPSESRIRNLFGFFTRSGSGRSPAHQNTASSWEIIVPEEEVEPPPRKVEPHPSP
ncbi:RILP-like protein 1 isoform X1 [Megalops cyprinoides]|uniref:RILP-like protein 1 isoform X1 n=1 Tax=Megalops cyprinoides TaxID=118141 RepID=UPI001863C8B9|nr:RILP-like protein 1 isoform X1 [Megalops cyprinoides]